MSSVSKVSDSIVLSVPLPVASVVMSPGSVAVADAGGGGGGGATPQVVISPARAEKDSKMKLRIVERLSNIRSKEAQDYLAEILNNK